MWYGRRQVRHVQTWWWNEEGEKKVNEKKSKFKVWCWSKGTAAEKAVLNEYVAAKIAKKAVAQAQQWDREIRRKARHRRRAEICVQDCKADSKGEAGYGWSGNIQEIVKKKRASPIRNHVFRYLLWNDSEMMVYMNFTLNSVSYTKH